MHLIDKAGNDACPLLSINELRRLRMVIDYGEGKSNVQGQTRHMAHTSYHQERIDDDTTDKGSM